MNIDVETKLRASIKKHEGFRKFCYLDSRGCPTIGYGRNLRDTGINEKEAELLLADDIKVSQEELYHHLPFVKTLDDVRRAVLIEMTFNMGIGNVLEFRNMIAALKIHDYKAAAAAMLDSEWANQVNGRANDMAYSMEMGIL